MKTHAETICARVKEVSVPLLCPPEGSGRNPGASLVSMHLNGRIRILKTSYASKQPIMPVHDGDVREARMTKRRIDDTGNAVTTHLWLGLQRHRGTRYVKRATPAMIYLRMVLADPCPNKPQVAAIRLPCAGL